MVLLMIKRTTPQKHFCSVAVLSTICFSTCLSVSAKPIFDLPHCPAVKDKKEDTPQQQLAPIKLEAAPKQETSNTDSAKTTGDPIAGHAKPSSYDKAKSVNCLPLPLIPSIAETEESQKLQVAHHKQQIQDLWAAAIDRSPDIKFAIGVLQPNTNPKHATAQAMKLVGNALFNVGATM